jgi:Malectin domain
VRRFLFAFIFAALACLSARAQQQPIRVKCGGPAYTDSLGQIWAADFGFNEGTESSIPAKISGTNDPTLFQTGRYANTSVTPLRYSFALPNGKYHVNLYFAETYVPTQIVGGRIFNVRLDGTMAFQNLDVFSEAGANAALIKGMDVTVSTGKLVIEFDGIVQTPKVNAIEVLPGTSGPLMALNFQYPDGTPVSGTLAYNVSSTLLTFKGSEPLKSGHAEAVLFANPSALGVSAQFEVTLTLTDTAGHQLWEIQLNMNPAQVNLGAVQSSALNVIVQKL